MECRGFIDVQILPTINWATSSDKEKDNKVRQNL